MIVIKNAELAKEQFGPLTHAKLLVVSAIAITIAVCVHIASSLINLCMISFSMAFNLLKIPNSVVSRAYKVEAFHRVVKKRTENGNV